MTHEAVEPGPPGRTGAENVIGVLNRLALDACRSGSLGELHFRMLNNSIALTPYDRAALVLFDGERLRIGGFSGQPDAARATELSAALCAIASKLTDKRTAAIISPTEFTELVDNWRVVRPELDVEAAWVPIVSGERIYAALWLERWRNLKWSEAELKLVGRLAEFFGAVREKFPSRFDWRKWTLADRPLSVKLGALTLLIGLLFLVRLPIKIVAACEVAPKNPFPITAPLDGVIEEIAIVPGSGVKTGDVLVRYDRRVVEEELQVVRSQVRVTRSELERANALAFRDDRLLAELAILRLRLEKENIRLRLAEQRASQLEIRSPQDGVVMMDDPSQWRGKPVRVGEKIMTVIDPRETLVQIWVPEDDNVVLDTTAAVRVFLNVSPATTRAAAIRYIADFTAIGPHGIPCFLVESEWLQTQHDVRTGLKGTAILFGENVSLFYWLFRRPWVAVRRFSGY